MDLEADVMCKIKKKKKKKKWIAQMSGVRGKLLFGDPW